MRLKDPILFYLWNLNCKYTTFILNKKTNNKKLIIFQKITFTVKNTKLIPSFNYIEPYNNFA